LVGVREGELCVRLQTPPAGGSANEALAGYLAGLLEVPQANIEIVAGHTNEQKIVAVTGIPPQEVTARLLAQLD
jgi:uncharacterized protein YggU (UPF0235/DUF167 family)